MSAQCHSYCSWTYKSFRLEVQGGLLLFVDACRSYVIVCQNWPETYEYSMNFHPIFVNNYTFDCGSITYLNRKYLTFCSFHRIEQNICLVGTSINKGCAVYYYSVVMHGLRLIRYLWTKCREKSVLRRLHRREQHTKKRRTLVYISGVRR